MTSLRIAKTVNLIVVLLALSGILYLVTVDQLITLDQRGFVRVGPNRQGIAPDPTEVFKTADPAGAFLYALLFAVVCTSVGGHIGSIAEENPSGELDLGVTSAAGAFVLGLTGTTFGATLSGLDITRSVETSVLVVMAVLLFYLLGGGAVRLQRDPATLETENERAASGKALPGLKLRDKMTIVVGLIGIFLALQAAVSILILHNQPHNQVQTVLHRVLFAVIGAAAGGAVGGWTSGICDVHHGRPETDNPILVSGLGMMAGLAGGVLGGIVGGLAGGVTVVPQGDLVTMGALAGTVIIGAVFFLTVALRRITLLPRRLATATPTTAPEPQMNRTITLDASERVEDLDEVHRGRYGETLQVRVEGIVSSLSVRKIEVGLGKVDGIVTVTVDSSRGTVTTTFDHQQLTRADVLQKLVDMGFPVVG